MFIALISPVSVVLAILLGIIVLLFVGAWALREIFSIYLFGEESDDQDRVGREEILFRFREAKTREDFMAVFEALNGGSLRGRQEDAAAMRAFRRVHRSLDLNELSICFFSAEPGSRLEKRVKYYLRIREGVKEFTAA